MTEHAHGHPGTPKSDEDLRYETKDLRPKDVVRGAVGLLVFTLTTAAVCYGITVMMRNRTLGAFDAGADTARASGPLAVAGDQVDAGPHGDAPLRTSLHHRFQKPRLQEFPAHDLATLRAEEDAFLKDSGWVDPAARTVRLPVEQAMVIVAQRGLPARPAPAGTAPAPAPSPAPTEPVAPAPAPGGHH